MKKSSHSLFVSLFPIGLKLTHIHVYGRLDISLSFFSVLQHLSTSVLTMPVFLLTQRPMGDKVSVLAHTCPHKPLKKTEWLPAIARLTAHFTCGMIPDHVICKHSNEYGQT